MRRKHRRSRTGSYVELLRHGPHKNNFPHHGPTLHAPLGWSASTTRITSKMLQVPSPVRSTHAFCVSADAIDADASLAVIVPLPVILHGFTGADDVVVTA